MNNELRDEDFLEYMLGSIQIIEERVEGMTKEEYDNDLLTKDSVQHRLHQIGLSYTKLSENTRKEIITELDGFSSLMVCLEYHQIPENKEWKFISNWKSNFLFGTIETIGDLFYSLELIYFKLFHPKKYKGHFSQIEKKKVLKPDYSTDYPYPIKTSKSIWTVKK